MGILSLLFLAASAHRVPSPDVQCVLANTSSTSSTLLPLPIPRVFGGQIPQPGQKYCDPVFGSASMRLADQGQGDVNIQDLQNAAFSNYLTANGMTSRGWVILSSANGTVLYDFNPVAMTSSGVGVLLAPKDVSNNSLGMDANNTWWSGDTTDANMSDTLIFVAANTRKLYKWNISNLTNKAILISDLSSAFSFVTPPSGDNYYFSYCSAGSGVGTIDTAGTSRIYCNINLVKNSTGDYFTVGWVVWTPKVDTGDGITYSVTAQFIHGRDSADGFTYHGTGAHVSADDGHTYEYFFKSDLNYPGIYKSSLSQNGLYLRMVISYTLSRIDGVTNSDMQAMFQTNNGGAWVYLDDPGIIASRTATNWGQTAGPVRGTTLVQYHYGQRQGHAAMGATTMIAQGVGGYDCRGYCVPAWGNNGSSQWVLSAMTSDPGLSTNKGTQITPDLPFWTLGTGGGNNLNYFNAASGGLALNGTYADCNYVGAPGNLKWCNELLVFDPAVNAYQRRAHTRQPYLNVPPGGNAYLTEGHPMRSPWAPAGPNYAIMGTSYQTLQNPSGGVIRTVAIVRIL